MDDEIKGSGNSLDFGARIYDPRIGRWLSRDRFTSKYPSLSAYNFVANSPLMAIDPDGDTIRVISVWNGFFDPGHTAIALVGKNVVPFSTFTKERVIDGGFRSGVRFWNPIGDTKYGGGEIEEISIRRYSGDQSYIDYEDRQVSIFADYERTIKAYLERGENVVIIEWVLPDEVEQAVNEVIAGKRFEDYGFFGCASSCQNVLYDAFIGVGYSEEKASEYSSLIINAPRPKGQDLDTESLKTKGAVRKKVLEINEEDKVIHSENEVLNSKPLEFNKK